MMILLHRIAAPGLLLLAVAALAALSAALPGDRAAAGAFTVTKQADTADGNCDSDCSLREAIIASNASPGADVVSLPAGEYNLSIVGADEDAAATGDLDITSDITINGPGAASTVVDANGLDRVFHLPGVYGGTAYALAMSGITVRGGDPSSGGGGGISSFHSAVTVSESVVMANTANYAGGIESVGGTMVLIDSAVSGNAARGQIGGITNNTGSLTITGSTISGNTATNGHVGGVNNSGGDLTILNSTVSGNSSVGTGGGIASNNTLVLSGVTITGNLAGAGDGGGIVQEAGAVSLKNTIVAGNTGATGSSDCAGTLTSEGHNLIESLPAGCTIAGDTTGNILGQDPLLDPLADNGGLTQTHALQPGSPAIDTAANDGCPGTDQRGFARPFDGDGDNDPVCDIGAYEFGSSPPTPTPTGGPPQEVVWGDNRCNGDVDSTDALAVLRYVAQLSPLAQTEPCPDVGAAVGVEGFGDQKWGDVDCGGNVTSVDALADLRDVAALPPLAQHEPCPDIGTEVSVTG